MKMPRWALHTHHGGSNCQEWTGLKKSEFHKEMSDCNDDTNQAGVGAQEFNMLILLPWAPILKDGLKL